MEQFTPKRSNQLIRRVLLAVLCLLAGRLAFAQPPRATIRMRHLTERDGLSSNRINCLVQDGQGFMWFATDEGLNRYDGHSVKVYAHIPLDTTSLSSNLVTHLLADRRGILWAGTAGGGLNRYDPARGTFRVYRHDPANPRSLPGNHVQYLYEDRAGNLWIGGDGGQGLHRFDAARQTFTSFYPGAGLHSHLERERNNSVLWITEAADGALWLATRGGLHRFDVRTGQSVAYYDQPESPHRYFENLITVLYPDPHDEDQLWLGCWGGGLKSFNTRTKSFRTFRYAPAHVVNGEHNLVLSVLDKSPDELWVCSLDRGLAVFHKRTGQYTPVPVDRTDPQAMQTVKANHLYRDRDGALWIGTQEGVSLMNPYSDAFHHVALPGTSEALPNTVVAGYHNPDDGKMLAGVLAGGGLQVFDPARGGVQTIPFIAGAAYHDIRAFYRDRAGRLWLTTNAGIYRALARQYAFSRVYPAPGGPPLSDVVFRQLLEDAEGNLWVGTEQSGLYRFDRGASAPRVYGRQDGQPGSIAGNAIYALYRDRRGRVWAGTENGLSRYDPATDRFVNFRPDPGRPGHLPSKDVFALAEDGEGNLWVGTNGGGLCQWLPGPGRFRTLTVGDGLPSNRIWSMTTDARGRLWLGTTKGLSCLDTRTGQFRNYDRHDGLATDYVSALLHTSYTGYLMIGFRGGFTYFHPDSLQFRAPAPRLAVHTFRVFDREAALDSLIAVKKQIDLHYHQNFFSFGFAGLNFINPEKNRYFYRLDPYDKRWVDAGNRGYASYTGVPPGRYVLRIRAFNRDGAEATPGEAIRIYIAPPWWQTWWAYAAYGLLGGLLLVAARRLIVNRERLKADLRVQQVASDKLRELDTLKSQFFANISHEFRTPLSLILGTLEGLLEEKKNPARFRPQFELLHRNAGRLLQLINQLLDLSRLEAGRLQLDEKPSNLSRCLGVIAGSFASLAERQGIRYAVDLPPEPVWAGFDADKLEKILGNLLSNAFKFTPRGGTVTLGAHVQSGEDGHQLRLVVTDTGIGIPPEQLSRIFDRFYQVDHSPTHVYGGSGIGLALAKELTELHRGRIAVESTVGTGTTFTVALSLPAAAPDAAVPKPAPPDEWVAAGPAHVPEAEGAAGASSYQTKVLIVEDNADLRSYIRAGLPRHYQLMEAENGQQGWEAALANLPDLVITDVMMPELDGLTLCQRLKSHPTTLHIPVILLTARAGTEDKIEGLLTGADDYLTKPFHGRELAVRATNLIEERKRLWEHFGRQVLLQPAPAKFQSADEVFLERVIKAVEAHLADPDFDVEGLGQEVGLSRVQLYRKLYALTGQSPSDCIRTLRLRRGAELLAQKAGNVSEVAYRVGFKEPSYFSRCFSQAYGCSPSEYRSVNAPGG
jgi:signal transduction histidine kinase/ligand-binding sensor domain-containing protein/DNA-binding response OmpR family regulator